MFPERLKLLRAEKGLYQKDIAQKMNITTSAYGFYEQAKRTPDTDTLIRLADFFDVSLDYLLGRTTIRETAVKYLYKNINAGNKDNDIVAEFPEEAREELEQYVSYLKHKYKKEK